MRKSEKRRMNNIKQIKDKDIDYSDIPELDDSFWSEAVIEYPEKKKPVTLRIDADVIEWFRASGKGYQTRINAVLRSYFEVHRRDNT